MATTYTLSLGRLTPDDRAAFVEAFDALAIEHELGWTADESETANLLVASSGGRIETAANQVVARVISGDDLPRPKELGLCTPISMHGVMNLLETARRRIANAATTAPKTGLGLSVKRMSKLPESPVSASAYAALAASARERNAAAAAAAAAAPLLKERLKPLPQGELAELTRDEPAETAPAGEPGGGNGDGAGGQPPRRPIAKQPLRPSEMAPKPADPLSDFDLANKLGASLHNLGIPEPFESRPAVPSQTAQFVHHPAPAEPVPLIVRHQATRTARGADAWTETALTIHGILQANTGAIAEISIASTDLVQVDFRFRAFSTDVPVEDLPIMPSAVAIRTVTPQPDWPPAFVLPGQPLDKLLWFIGSNAFDGARAPWLDADDRYRLQRWPNFTEIAYQIEHMRMTALIGNTPMTVAELAETCDVPLNTAQRMINAYSLMGLLAVVPKPVPAPPEPAAFAEPLPLPTADEPVEAEAQPEPAAIRSKYSRKPLAPTARPGFFAWLRRLLWI